MPDRNDFLRKLAPLVARAEWDMFCVYLSNKLIDEREALEVCSAEGLKPIQAKISVYKELLTLRDTVNNVIK